MQRREQQKRAAAGMGGGGNSGGFGSGMGSGGGSSGGYAPVPQRFDAPSPAPRTASPAQSSLRAPAFKGSGMKLGSKKTKQAELLDALGGEALVSEDMSQPATPIPTTSPELGAMGGGAVSRPKDAGRGSVPTVTPERYILLLSISRLVEVQYLTWLVTVFTLSRRRPSTSLSPEKAVSSPWTSRVT